MKYNDCEGQSGSSESFTVQWKQCLFSGTGQPKYVKCYAEECVWHAENKLIKNNQAKWYTYLPIRINGIFSC